MEPVGLKSYMLIRVGLDVGEDQWFGLRLGLPETIEEPCFGEAPKDRLMRRSRKPRIQREARQTESGLTKSVQNKLVQSANQEAEMTQIETGWSRMLHLLSCLRLYREKERNRRHWERQMRTAKMERERLLAEREERILQADMAVRRLAGEVLELTEDRSGCRLVYEGAVRKALVSSLKNGKAAEDHFAQEQDEPALQRERSREPWQGQERGREPWQKQKAWKDEGAARGEVLRGLWNKHFDMEEFRDYRQRFWVERLLPHAGLCHYVILGTAPCIYEIIEERAGGMKSLRWMLLETDCDQELWDFVEDFYTEYGLAIDLRTFESEGAFGRQRDLCGQPSNIIDFTGDLCFSVTEVPEGSVWLDMLSSEEKRYRIQGRRTGVEYVSLKQEWKRAKRRCAPPEW